MRLLPAQTLGDLGPQKGEVVRIDGFPGRSRVLNTVSVRSLSYVGDVIIEASIVEEPDDDDWHAVHTFTFDDASKTLGTNVNGKFIWLRFVVMDEDNKGELDRVMIR